MASVAVVMVLKLLLLGFLSLFTTLLDDFDVIVQNRGNDGDHVGLHDPGPDIFGPANADIHHTLEGEIPLPHAHHILTSTLLKNAY